MPGFHKFQEECLWSAPSKLQYFREIIVEGEGAEGSDPLSPWRTYREALIRIEEVAFDTNRPRRRSVQLRHRSCQAEPVQHFLLSGTFHCRQGRLTPVRVPPGSQRVIKRSIALHVRI